MILPNPIPATLELFAIIWFIHGVLPFSFRPTEKKVVKITPPSSASEVSMVWANQF